jgi:DtxR family Mn-dependent transcriptional regulator
MVASLIFIFHPKFGLLTSFQKLKMNYNRVKMEDALKHLFDCEYNKIDCTIHSISGTLSIKYGNALKLISKLEKLKLIKIKGNKLVLTDEGKTYAVKIIRIHRLWERYLADHTSIDESDWHRLAELKEHEHDSVDVNELSAKLGNPLTDPHGDLIPNQLGVFPKRTETRLQDLKTGSSAQIIHIEDEPYETYKEISNLGLHPGTQINIIESNLEIVKLIADGSEVVLNPILANQITVEPITEYTYDTRLITLSSLKSGEVAYVVKLSNGLHGQQRRRLLDFGIVPGTKITAKLQSIGGDPKAFEVRGSIIALRKKQSDLIFVNTSPN